MVMCQGRFFAGISLSVPVPLAAAVPWWLSLQWQSLPGGTGCWCPAPALSPIAAAVLQPGAAREPQAQRQWLLVPQAVQPRPALLLSSAPLRALLLPWLCRDSGISPCLCCALATRALRLQQTLPRSLGTAASLGSCLFLWTCLGVSPRSQLMCDGVVGPFLRGASVSPMAVPCSPAWAGTGAGGGDHHVPLAPCACPSPDTAQQVRLFT